MPQARGKSFHNDLLWQAEKQSCVYKRLHVFITQCLNWLFTVTALFGGKRAGKIANYIDKLRTLGEFLTTDQQETQFESGFHDSSFIHLSLLKHF